MSLTQGIAAGAAGTAVLDAATYADMALTGREASDAPARTVLAVADRLGLDLPDGGSRPEAYGAIAGIGTGVAIGVLASGLRTVGVRLPLLAEAAVIGAGAMLATDGPMQRTGVADLRSWTVQDWTRDAVPHYAYGLAVASTLRHLERDGEPSTPAKRSTTSTLVRSLALGAATGARSSMGLVPPAFARGTRGVALGAAGLVATELVMDKKASTPSRLGVQGSVPRLLFGAIGAATAARDDDHGWLMPALAGAVGAAGGTLLGWTIRDLCAARGWQWQSALAEDAVALGLTAWATR